MSSLPLCSSYAHIICITFLPKVSTIAITLSLFLLTSTTFPDSFFFHEDFNPLHILHHFLTTTVYAFVPKYPQNKLLGLSIFLPGYSTYQLFFSLVLHTLLFSFQEDFPHLNTKSYPVTFKFKPGDSSHPLPI